MRWLSDDKLNRLRAVVNEPGFQLDEVHRRERAGAWRHGYGVLRPKIVSWTVASRIKVVNTPEVTEDLKQRMVREAQIIARLEHPGIVPVHDVGTLPDGRIFYAMKLVLGSRLDEYAAGASLRDRLRKFQACVTRSRSRMLME
jgi:serine/threonine protein kinase